MRNWVADDKLYEIYKAKFESLNEENYEFLGVEYKEDKNRRRAYLHLLHNKCGNSYWVRGNCFFNAGQRCPNCRRKRQGESIAKSHKKYVHEVFELVGDKYSVLSEYTLSKYKILFKHNECNREFEMLPASFLAGSRCPYCKNKRISDTLKNTHESFIFAVKELVGNEYTVIGEYTIGRNKIKMRHNVCNSEYDVRASHFLSGSRCPICNESKMERETSQYLDYVDIIYNSQYIFLECKYKKPLKFDFYIPSINTCVELNGIQHYEPCDWFGGEETFKIQQIKDQIKRDYCAANGIQLIEIPYWDKHRIPEILSQALSLSA
jgi:Zn ribbon nucleic-acid-binding protein